VDLALSFPLVQRFWFIPPHGLFTAIGFVVGAWVLMREIKRRDLDPDIVVNALTWAAAGAIFGARADYVISHPDSFFGRQGFVDSLISIVRVWEGGLALFGGFIGGVLFAVPVLVRNRVHIPRALDAAAPGMAIGVAVGRIGDLIIGDHLGDPVTGNPWWKAFTYTIRNGDELAPGFGPSPARPGPCGVVAEFYAGCSYHIPALYDLVGAALLFGLLMWLRGRWRFRSGQLVLTWGVWYGLQRVLLDFTRSIDERPAFEMTGTQLLGVILAAFCAVLLLWTAKRGYGLAEGPDSPVSREASLHTHARPGDAAGGELASDEDADDERAATDATEVPTQESGVDSDASNTPSEKPRA
jgi:phosphatidylglycerol:prolipoprotein diacylglycerol transferase